MFKLGKSATWDNFTCTAVPQRVKKAAAPGLRRRFAPAKALRDFFFFSFPFPLFLRLP